MFFEFNNKANTIIKLDDIQYVEKQDNGTYNNIVIQLKKCENLCYIGYKDEQSRDKDYELLKQELLPHSNIENTPFGYLFTKDYNSNRSTIYAGRIGEVKRVETHTTKSDVVIVDGEVIFEIGSANAKKYGRPIFK